jgi:hypothetical protein
MKFFIFSRLLKKIKTQLQHHHLQHQIVKSQKRKLLMEQSLNQKNLLKMMMIHLIN